MNHISPMDFLTQVLGYAKEEAEAVVAARGKDAKTIIGGVDLSTPGAADTSAVVVVGSAWQGTPDLYEPPAEVPPEPEPKPIKFREFL